MKNVLARGGIEFLAVLLGISGSLWLDDRSTFTQERKYEVEAYQRLSNALSVDMQGLKEDAEKNHRMIYVLGLMINRMNTISNDSLLHYIDITQSYTDMETHVSDYETLKNTGRLYSISNMDMLQRVIDMYDKKYGEISDWKAEDKRAIFMQDEFFIKNYAMQPADSWTTLRDIKKDRQRLINDDTYRNYLIFLYQVKNRMNAEWNKLIIDIESLNKDILVQVRELED
jgi:predicted hydrocarbon binding protein